MFSLSKKTEYGLLAMIHLSRLDQGQLANVSQIAESTTVPRELLAKILSELVKADLAVSYSGPNGGFRLARPASAVSLAEILRVLESKTGLIECLSQNGRCDKSENCSIKKPMSGLHHKFRKILEETMLTDLIHPHREGEALLTIASSPTTGNS
jgi:Rrf2 family protein